MVRRGTGVRNRVRFDSKAALLAGGADVWALRYQRASQDKKEQGKSVGDQGKLNVAEINRNWWTRCRLVHRQRPVGEPARDEGAGRTSSG